MEKSEFESEFAFDKMRQKFSEMSEEEKDEIQKNILLDARDFFENSFKKRRAMPE